MRGLQQISCITEDIEPYSRDNGNSDYVLACYVNEPIIRNEYTHFYEGSTDPTDHGWILICEIVLYDPDGERAEFKMKLTDETIVNGTPWSQLK